MIDNDNVDNDKYRDKNFKNKIRIYFLNGTLIFLLKPLKTVNLLFHYLYNCGNYYVIDTHLFGLEDLPVVQLHINESK